MSIGLAEKMKISLDPDVPMTSGDVCVMPMATIPSVMGSLRIPSTLLPIPLSFTYVA